jgi:sporulation protein YunB
VILIVVVVLLIVSLVRLDRAVRPAAVMQAENFAKMQANEAIGSAVAEYLADHRYEYCDFAAVLYDESGRAVSVEALPVNINRVQSELTVLINRRLRESGGSSAEIALGSLTGSYLLAGKGPRVRVRVCPADSCVVRLKSTFSQAGINQTCHCIYAEVTAEVTSSLPLYSFSTEVCFDFLLAESVIVGDVPEISRYAWNEK